MKINKISILDPFEEYPHSPNGDPTFQESALFVWYDRSTGVGGFWRLGQEVVAGELNSCFGIFTDDGLRFRSNVTGVPLKPSDRGEDFMAWGPALRVDLSALSITADFPDCEAQLRFADFYPRYNWYQLLGMPAHHSHHFEVAGRVTGKVLIGGREVVVDALGYRDRSWGSRIWGGMRGTRWWPSVFGPDLTVFLCANVFEPRNYGAYGYIFRNGRPQTVRDVDVAVLLDSDAISPRAGYGSFRLETGEIVQIRQERSDGLVLHVRGFTAVESIGRAYLGDREGMSNLEVCTNPAGGSLPPVLTLGANNAEGLSRA